MKNSTLINIVVFGGIIGWLLYLFTFVVAVILISLIVALLFYLICCGIEYEYEDFIPHEYNIYIKIGKFYEWVDSKPKMIKPSKKNWRTPEDWNGEV